MRQLLVPRQQLMEMRYVPRALRLVWAAASGWTLASTLLLVIQGVLPVFTVFLTREVVNSLIAVINSSGDPSLLRSALISSALMGAVLLTGEVLGSLQTYVRTLLAERTQDFMNDLIHTKAISLDLQFYESPVYYDQMQRASVDAIDRPLGLLDSLNSLLQNSITLVAMGGVLLTFAWWVPLVLLVGTMPALWVALRATLAYHRWRLRNTLNQRRLNYHHRILSSDQSAAELRLFNLGDHFKEAYSRLRRQIRDERLILSREQMAWQMGASLIGLVSLALPLSWMAWQALQGLFSLGALAMFWQAMNQGQRLMRSLLTGIGDIYRNLVFLEDLFDYLDLEPVLAEPDQPITLEKGLNQGIRIEEVEFSYPENKNAALSQFSLDIPAGQVVAIVGENGAGKSTLLKLLCRFYDPQKGRITWDGVDLRLVAQAELRRHITVLFQQPTPYHESAADNIRFGNLASRPSQTEVDAAARAGGAQEIIHKLPYGYETILGKWFGHTELSVGEWQRIALARAFIRQADLVILDEPTSAMDSWAENAWMGRFRNLVAGRTAIIITHRFTTAMQADIIHVMVHGRIVESGSHAELVALGGRYAESWQAQMQEAGGIR